MAGIHNVFSIDIYFVNGPKTIDQHFTLPTALDPEDTFAAEERGA